LKSLPKQFGIISILGSNFILNSILEKNLSNSKTENIEWKGIIIRNKPIYQGYSFPIYIIQVEAFKENNENNHKAILMLFSFLFSSSIFFNSKGVIDDKFFESLDFLNMIEQKCKYDINEIPPFTWILHEFPLKLDSETSPKDYWRNASTFYEDENSSSVRFIKCNVKRIDCLILHNNQESMTNSINSLLSNISEKKFKGNTLDGESLNVLTK
jgi:hypothetical protein